MHSVDSQDDAKNDIFRAMARMGQAFASPQRLQIIALLAHGSRTVEQLAAMTSQSLALTSSHLKILRAAALVVSDKTGRHQHCRLATDSVAKVFLMLRSLGEELMPEVRELVRQYFSNPEMLSPMSVKELKAELKAGRVRLIDLRPSEEYKTGHVPGAISLPFDQIAERHREFSATEPWVAYCRGPYCLMAIRGVEKLRQLGLPVQRLNFSVPEWKASGYRMD